MKKCISVMLASLVAVSLCGFSAEWDSKVVNGDFERGFSAWAATGKARWETNQPEPGKCSAVLGPGPGALSQRIESGHGCHCTLAATLASTVTNGDCLAIRCLDEDGQELMRVAGPAEIKRDKKDPRKFSHYMKVHPRTKWLEIVITNSAPDGKLRVGEVALSLSDENAATNQTTADLDASMQPFWQGRQIYHEAVLMLSEADKPATGQLLFVPTRIISVQDYGLATNYLEGTDYAVNGRTLTCAAGSRLPHLRAEDLLPGELAWNQVGGKQVLVTYEHDDTWSHPTPAFLGDALPATMRKLRSHAPLTVVAYGDSITHGVGSSQQSHIPPYQPPWPELFRHRLQAVYPQAAIRLYNSAQSGATADWGQAMASRMVSSLHPDLVLVAFGQNDFWSYSADDFSSHIASVISTVQAGNPAAEFLLISPMRFDPAYSTNRNYAQVVGEYAARLKALTRPGVQLVDMTAWTELLYAAKKPKDFVNDPLHPNDYLARWYAQCVAAALEPMAASGALPARQISFDPGWRFHRGGAEGAQDPLFDDSGWRGVDLPHDWSIEDLPGTDSPFARDAISQVSGGFTVGGTGWYRKSFVVSPSPSGRRVAIQFDGAYMNAEVWLNGQPLGSHPYGYTPFWFDLTEKLSATGTNLLAVKIANEGENSRWYSGSGLYRHVWLKQLNPIHVAPDGVYVTTPELSSARAGIQVRTRVANEAPAAAEVQVRTRVVNALGQAVALLQSTQSVEPGSSREVTQTGSIPAPELWSLDHPTLYTNLTEIYVGEQLQDRVATSFGIRQISIDGTNGFRLNGQPLKLQGGCLHHDNGPLGACAYDRAEVRKVEILKASGFNAVRCAHNPPSPAFLDACDHLGLLVLDEAFDMWDTGKNPADYHLFFPDWWRRDLEGMVFRDRNHPAVVLWSIGNEIPGMETPTVAATARRLADAVRELDPTRQVTAAVNDLRPDKDAYFAALDVAGYNYAVGGDHGQSTLYDLDHQRVPGRVMLGTESYPLATFDSWMPVLDHPYVIGDFVWTAWDYVGEASIGWRGYDQFQDFFPWNLAYCGDIDICGWRRPQSFCREALWRQNALSLFVQSPTRSFPENPRRQSWSKWHFDDLVADWNWENAAAACSVTVFSSCEQVELFLNGKSLGRQRTGRAQEFKAEWPVKFQPGTLKAVGYASERPVAVAELRSAKAPARLQLTTDRQQLAANGQDLAYVTVNLLDAEGVPCPKAADLVRFEVAGPGSLVGVGNANPMSLESYQRPERQCWRGRCLAILKAGTQPGRITLHAKVENLAPVSLELTVGR